MKVTLFVMCQGLATPPSLPAFKEALVSQSLGPVTHILTVRTARMRSAAPQRAPLMSSLVPTDDALSLSGSATVRMIVVTAAMRQAANQRVAHRMSSGVAAGLASPPAGFVMATLIVQGGRMRSTARRRRQI